MKHPGTRVWYLGLQTPHLYRQGKWWVAEYKLAWMTRPISVTAQTQLEAWAHAIEQTARLAKLRASKLNGTHI